MVHVSKITENYANRYVTTGKRRIFVCMEAKIRRFIESNSLLEAGDRVVVGVSGGADSVALLRILSSCGYDCVPVHCNFHLRGEESDRDCAFTRNLCSAMGLDLQVVDYDTENYAREKGLSIEMAARELRYADFEKIRVETGAAAIAIAHHQDDSVETVLMNLVRGTGIRGLTGIKPKNGYVIRPLLAVTRAEILTYLEGLGQDYVTDSTNLESVYTRNRFRLDVMPLLRTVNPQADRAILQTASHLNEVMALYRKQVQECMSRIIVHADNGFEVDIPGLLDTPSPRGMLFEILAPYGYNDSQIDDILESLGGESGRVFSCNGCIVVKDRDRLVVSEKGVDVASDCIIQLADIRDGVMEFSAFGRQFRMEIRQGGQEICKDSCVGTFDMAKLNGELVIRQWRQGDWFVPFGMKGRRLLSDFMTDRKLNILEKQQQLVLCNGNTAGDIVWVVGQRGDNRFRVGPDTKLQLVVFEI